MRTLLLGLQLWNVLNNAPWHGSAHLKRAIQGSSSAAPTLSTRPRCPPVTLAHLLSLEDTLDINNTFDATVFSTATMAFWCQCHLSKVCVISTLNPLLHTTRACQQKSGKTASNIAYHSFWAPAMKTSLHGDEIRWVDSCCHCSREWAFQNHWAVNACVPPSSHLFGFKTISGHF